MKHSDFCERITEYTKSLGLKKIVIPELGTEEDPYVIYARPKTSRDLDAFGKLNNKQEFNVKVIYTLAVNEDGTPALLKSDVMKLYEAGLYDLLKRIADEMFFHTSPAVDDLKN